MKKLLLLLCLLVMSRAGAEENIIFTDDAGREVCLNQHPERVAVLFSSFADMWKTAGGETAITVQETVDRGILDEGVLLTDDGAGKQIHQELLLSYAPDLVIASMDIPAQVDAAALCEQAGIPVALFKVDSFTDYMRVFEIMTRITGNDENFAKYGLNVQCEVTAVLDEAKTQETRTVLFIRAGSGPSSTKAKRSQDHFAASMLREMGLTNIADDTAIWQDTISMEYVLMTDPDYIFFSLMGNEKTARENVDALLRSAEYAALTAVREGRVHILPRELFHFKPNHRWGESYRYLAQILWGGV